MPPKKTVLFVTYGGGHARMVVPVLKALSGNTQIQTLTLALTSAGPIFDSAGMPYLGYKDILTADDYEARAWGEKLAKDHHRPESGIEEAESIAYLGLSYWDLVLRYGEIKAAQLFQDNGRQAFLPLSVMERVIARYKPDMVVTTSSPRSEMAAIEIARQQNIPTMSMIDLPSIYPYNPFNAEYLTVLSEVGIEFIEKYSKSKFSRTFLITGNPAFDPIFDERGPIDYTWRRRNLPTMPEQAKALLFIDTQYDYNAQDFSVHLRSDDDIRLNLDQLASATHKSDACLLIRPHPSQSTALYKNWIKESGHPNVYFAGDFPLHPLLRAVDAVTLNFSTVGCEAILMQRPVLQLNYHGEVQALPLGKWGLAMLVNNPDDLADSVHTILNTNKEIMDAFTAQSEKLFPQEKAAPKIAAHIEQIVFTGKAQA